MSCPAVEHGKAIAESNARRMGELAEEFKRVGVFDLVNEMLSILNTPDSAHAARLERRRADLQSKIEQF